MILVFYKINEALMSRRDFKKHFPTPKALNGSAYIISRFNQPTVMCWLMHCNALFQNDLSCAVALLSDQTYSFHLPENKMDEKQSLSSLRSAQGRRKGCKRSDCVFLN